MNAGAPAPGVPLSREAIASVDTSNQLRDVLALPEHLRDALTRVETAFLEARDTKDGLVVAGMGGSAIGGGTVATGGGIVFQATGGTLYAYSADKGEKLLELKTGIPGGMAPPITFMVDGKQYIAMPAGDPGLQGNWVLSAAPELGAVRGSKSSVLWVWELP